jgi:RNA recognition motif-containing protein
MMIENNIVRVMPFMGRNERPKSGPNFTNVYVKNLAPEVEESELQEAAAKFGTVTSCVIMRVGGWR